VFQGSSKLSLDGKGRLAVPAKYRDALMVSGEGQLVLTADIQRCLLIYPKPEWEPIARKLNGLSSFNSATRKLQRRLVGNAHDVEMDASGRVLIPPTLRDLAGLEKDVVLVGQGGKFELWSEQGWRAEMEAVEAFGGGDELPPELEGFTL
jgi:transcriptional regulator MraZ